MSTTSVKFFTSSMTGAPVIAGNNKGSLIALLDACLINGWGVRTLDSLVVSGDVATATVASGHGYTQHQVILMAGATPAELNGEVRVISTTTTTFTFAAVGVADGTATGTITSKVAPLGWTKPFSGTQLAAYRIDTDKYPDAPGCFVRFDEATGTVSAAVVGYESMTDINTGIMPFPTAAQVSGGTKIQRSNANNSTATPWFVVGDGQFVYLATLPHNGQGGLTWACFGAIQSRKSADPYRFVLSGQRATESTGSPPSNFVSLTSTSNGQFFSARSHTGLGGSAAVDMRPWVPFVTSSTLSSGGAINLMGYPNPSDYGLLLTPCGVTEGTDPVTLRGQLPGMLFIPQKAQNQICPDRLTPYFDTDVVGFEGKVTGFFPCIDAASSSNYGVVAFDLTGPWSH
jgi:hypothetical protein